MYNLKYDLSVKINGKNAKEYFHEGNYFIEGREKSEFQIQLKNSTSTKIKAIISVDGLSIVDGKEAGIDSQGYVLQPYETQTFDGWRTSMNSIAKFYFSSKKKSYTKRIGNATNNIGVIGAMIFTEKVQNYYSLTSTGGPWRSFTGSPYVGSPVFDSCYSASAPLNMVETSASIGTGFGEEIASNVVQDYSTFNENPDEIMCLYYDDKQGLEKRGIVVDIYKSMPNAFPSYLTNDRFAKRPIK